MWIISQIQSMNENEIASFFIGKHEGKVMDFKIKLNLGTDKDRKEFLADVSSFANAEGGVLVFGAKEVEAVCVEVLGVEVGNADFQKQQIENLLREGIQPNIPYYDIHIAKLSSVNSLIIIEVQQSYVKPHVVDYRGHWRVYSRNTVGKFPLDIFDLKSMVTSSTEMLSGLSKFRNQRISSILSEDLPVIFENPHSSKAVVQIFPQSAFYKNLSLNFSEIRRWTNLILPINGDSCTPRLNFDGLISISSGLNNTARKYFQLYRNGVIETVNGDLSHKNYDDLMGVWLDEIGNGIINFVQQAFNLYSQLQINPPVYLLISLLNLREQNVYFNSTRSRIGAQKKFDRHNLLVPEIVINDLNCNIKNELQEAFDMIWNSVGFDRAIL